LEERGIPWGIDLNEDLPIAIKVFFIELKLKISTHSSFSGINNGAVNEAM
jgi:hypothetical protein